MYIHAMVFNYNDVITCHVISPQLTVQCQLKKNAPCKMRRGSATTDGRFVYFAPFDSTSLYQYEYRREKWTDLPPCPYRNSGLAIIDSKVTTVGGWDGRYLRTNKLFTLQRGKWAEKYPPMNTACSSHAVVSIGGDYLIVIGGYVDGGHRTATVELFQVKKRRWHKLTDLPQPLPVPSATICGDLLNVIGDDGKGYSCSLQALPFSDRPITAPLALLWNPLPCLPVTRSTAATLCGQLVIIGGQEKSLIVDSILQLVDGEWVRIGAMANKPHISTFPSATHVCISLTDSDNDGSYYCLVANPSPDRIIIVGGAGGTDSVEECAVV